MPRKPAKSPPRASRPLEQYEHADKQRANNPPVGLVSSQNDAVTTSRTYVYDPYLDPTLVWAGKFEHTSFDVPTVSLHVHERIDPRTIIEAVQTNTVETEQLQPSLFEQPSENPPLRQALEFYKHQHGWTNRLIAGDSLLVMNSLIEKERLAGQVQMVYMDPPYGVRYGSNFQPFVNRRDVKDGKDDDLTQEPEVIRAFRDTWELGIHSYLTYLRDRLLLARELLSDSGSCMVQISSENLHHVRELMEEIFLAENRLPMIAFRKTTGAGSPSGYVETLPETFDLLLWYAKSKPQVKFRRLFWPRSIAEDYNLRWLEMPDGSRRRMTESEISAPATIPAGSRPFRPNPLTSQTGGPTTTFPIDFEGKQFRPSKGGWKTNREGIARLLAARRLMANGNTLSFIRYLDDFPYRPVVDIWDDTRTSGFGDPKIFVVQTNAKVIRRCVMMTTDPGDLVFDPTCGSGTTAYVAEQWGRRWITCDTSRVAITLAKQRLMTAVYDYYELARPDEGVGSGLRYRTVQHVTLKSIAQNEPPAIEALYDQPLEDRSKTRITGPFTVEAVPSAIVMPLETSTSEANGPVAELTADASIAREGATIQQQEWRDALLKSGIRGKRNQMIHFSRVEPLPGLRWLHADAETRPTDAPNEPAPERAVISFGPEHAPIDAIQVERALQDAQKLLPRPRLVIFAAFQFDPEAAKDIDEMSWPGVTLLKVQMNADLLTADLKKKRASNESFWLIGQPDAELRTSDQDPNKYVVEVRGFDYYNTRTGTIESGESSRIAMWLLDTDYDGRSLFPRQVFFPMAGDKEGWAKLARSLRADIALEDIDKYRGTVSLPFSAGRHSQAGVKIVDDRGIESLTILPLPT